MPSATSSTPSTRCARPAQRMLRVIGNSRTTAAVIELVINDRRCARAMLSYSVNVLWLAALISVVIVGPSLLQRRPAVRAADAADVAEHGGLFRGAGRRRRGSSHRAAAATKSASPRTISPPCSTISRRTLREQRHLADLGLAVSKINHDLRNMLASAQLFSDRLGSLPDPTVQRFAPKLIAALDRAIAYCQTTLAYGRARRSAAGPAPGGARSRLVDDVADVLGLVGHPDHRLGESRARRDSRSTPIPTSCSGSWSISAATPSRRSKATSIRPLVRRLTISGEREQGSVDDQGRGYRARASPRRRAPICSRPFRAPCGPAARASAWRSPPSLPAPMAARFRSLEKAGPGAASRSSYRTGRDSAAASESGHFPASGLPTQPPFSSNAAQRARSSAG